VTSASAPRVLFVSKPIAPPWHDGSKNLVRDVASFLRRASPTVLTVPGAPAIGERVAMEPVYASSGRFAPGVRANARVLRRLLTGDPHDAWHFFFAPNAASSTAARVAHATRRALGWRGKVFQTVASVPRRFEGAAQLLFGDVVVVLSEHTRARFIGAGIEASRMRVVPPCAAAPRQVSDEERAKTREAHGLGDGPVVLYPGDYEVSVGADTVARAVRTIAQAVPEARVVFACRPKTKDAHGARARIERELAEDELAQYTRHVGELPDLAPLLAVASVVVFPVDDLYGKVDLPLVLLEAIAAGVPVVVARGGPLEALDGAARYVEPGDAEALAREVLAIVRDDGRAGELADRGRAAWTQRYRPEVVAAAYDDLYA